MLSEDRLKEIEFRLKSYHAFEPLAYDTHQLLNEYILAQKEIEVLREGLLYCKKIVNIFRPKESRLAKHIEETLQKVDKIRDRK